MAYHNTPGHHRGWRSMSVWELDEIRTEVRRLLRCEDIEIKEIATRTGYSSRQIERIAKKMGIGPRGHRLTEEEKERIRELGRWGLSGCEIGMRIHGNVSSGSIARILKILDKAGIPRRHKGEIWPGDIRYGHRCKGNVGKSGGSR